MSIDRLCGRLLPVLAVCVASGCATTPSPEYFGETNDRGERHGYGELYDYGTALFGSPRFLSYEGHWRNGKLHGPVISYGCLGEVTTCVHYKEFEGEFRDGKRYEGVEWEIDGNGNVSQEGIWQEGVFRKTKSSGTARRILDALEQAADIYVEESTRPN